MLALYTMNQLQTETQRTPQAIRKVFKNNDKLKLLLPEHRIEKDNGRVYYDDTILNALLDYFGLSKNISVIAEEVGEGIKNTKDNENPQTTPPPPIEIDKQPSSAEQEKIEALQEQIELLKKQLKEEQSSREKEKADLEKQLQDKEAERIHFIGENSKLLNLLAAEKQEKDKLLLLMPPAADKKSIWSKLKGLFTSKGEAAKNE